MKSSKIHPNMSRLEWRKTEEGKEKYAEFQRNYRNRNLERVNKLQRERNYRFRHKDEPTFMLYDVIKDYQPVIIEF